MLILYDSEGRAKELEILEPVLGEAETKNLLGYAYQLLSNRGEFDAASFLAKLNFKLSKGTNPFRDKFSVLHAAVSLEEYEYFRKNIEGATNYDALVEFIRPFRLIASTITELGVFVRFVTCEIDLSRPSTTSPSANQALFTFPDSSNITYEGLNFRSKTEIKIFEALIRRGVLVLPLPVAVMGEMGRYREPDFIVFYNGKAGILEIHGDKWHPPETAANEHERRRAFTRLGINIYEIFGADRCWKNPDKVVDDFLQEFTR